MYQAIIQQRNGEGVWEDVVIAQLPCIEELRLWCQRIGTTVYKIISPEGEVV